MTATTGMVPDYGLCVVCGAPKTKRENEPPHQVRRRKTCGKPLCFRDLKAKNNKERWNRSGRRIIQEKACVVCGSQLVRGKSECADSYHQRKTCSTGQRGVVSECYRELCRINSEKGRKPTSNGLYSKPQFRHWHCARYMACLNEAANANAPRWDCPKNCPRILTVAG